MTDWHARTSSIESQMPSGWFPHRNHLPKLKTSRVGIAGNRIRTTEALVGGICQRRKLFTHKFSEIIVSKINEESMLKRCQLIQTLQAVSTKWFSLAPVWPAASDSVEALWGQRTTTRLASIWERWFDQSVTTDASRYFWPSVGAVNARCPAKSASSSGVVAFFWMQQLMIIDVSCSCTHWIGCTRLYTHIHGHSNALRTEYKFPSWEGGTLRLPWFYCGCSTVAATLFVLSASYLDSGEEFCEC